MVGGRASGDGGRVTEDPIAAAVRRGCAHPVTFRRRVEGQQVALTRACGRRALAVVIEYQDRRRVTREVLAFCGEHCAGDPARSLIAAHEVVHPVGA